MLTVRRNTTEYSYAVAALNALVADGWAIRAAYDGEEAKLETPVVEDAVKWTATCEEGFVRVTRGDTRATLWLVWQGNNSDPECVIADISASTIESLDAVSAVVDKVTASLDLSL
jgi:hypothetical protein